MNASKQSLRPKSQLLWQIFGSALSALVGWFTLNAFIFIWAFIARSEHHSNPPIPNEWLVGPAFVAMYSAAFVFATWLVALVPLYLLVPLRSSLWRWPICTICGALSGALIMFAFYGPKSPDRSSTVTIIFASISGGVTCLFAALTFERFHHASPKSGVETVGEA
jgi:RsiW-degrading membrane proteinase PrsW (M82 family)